MGKPKKGAKTHDEDINDDNEPNEEVTGKKSMEEPGAKTAPTAKKEKKKKKGKAKDDDDEYNDDNEPNEEVTGKKSMEEPGAKTAPTAKKEKKKKKGKAKDDDDDDEWSKDHELKVMSVERNVSVDDDDDDDVPAPTVKSKKGTKKKTMGLSAFQLLGELEDDSIVDKSDEDTQVFSHVKSDRGREDEAGENVAVETSKSKKKDKSKKQEKQKKAEDEDIDAIMASLEATDKTAKKKKGKKNKKIEEENSPEEETKEVVEVEKVEPKVVTIDDLDVDDAEYERKKKKKGKKGAEEVAQSKTVDDKQEHDDGDGEGDEGDEEGGQIKSAAQKRKEKREREKQKKIQEKQKQKKTSKKDEMEEGVKKDESSTQAKKEETDSVVMKGDDVGGKEGSPESLAVEGEDKEGGKEDKKKKKKKGVKEKEEKTKSTKQIAAIRERLKKIKEEEEKAREEEEKQRQLEEERIRKYEEQKRLEEERKLKKKMRKKEHIERLKKEGKFLTEKQKQDKKRLEQMLEAMKEAGAELPSKDEIPKKRPVYTKKKKVLAQGATDTQEKSPSPTSLTSPAEPVAHVPETDTAISAEKDEEGEDILEVDEAQNVEEKEEVKEVWDAESEDEDEEEEDEEEEDSKSRSAVEPVHKIETKEEEELSDEEEDDDDEEDAEEEEESSEESDSEPEDDLSPAERGRDKVTKRAEQANKERSTDNLRAPVVCVLGHVDTGKTKILDKLRRTNVQDGEAGGITQQIGATNVPRDAILDKTKMCKEFTKQELKLPGLLIIDTPGHESFSNLRVRGTSLCDIAILVVDIMHGLEPQTIESINLLKERKTPFVVALNKIDRLYQWKAQPMADVQNTVKKQIPHTKSEFDERAQQVILGLAQEGLNAALFYENKNHKEYISLIPTSAHSGDGMGNLVALICDLCQNLLAKRLMYSANLQAVVMEVKAITGMGTTIDVILINGTLNEGDTIVLAGTEGPIVTQIRGLLMPQPMKELRVKNQYEHHKTVKAAQGVKIIARDMEKALAGLPLYVAHDADEKEYFKDEVAAVLKDTLESIKVQERGVFVQASTLGSLEALLEFLRTSEIPFAGISIGPVHKKDIMKASVMLEHDSQYAVILAFDVKVERDAQELADNLGVRIFTADIIYHLFDAFTKYREDLKRKRQEEFKHIAVFPCKLRILPQFIFNSRDPIVVGVSVEAGFVKEGTPICVPSKEFVDLGRVASIEVNHKAVEVAKQGQEICIKIMPIPGEAPKMYGRHFDETDMLVSKISRQSIDAVKDHFREEMSKHDWKLMVELKKQFDIL